MLLTTGAFLSWPGSGGGTLACVLRYPARQQFLYGGSTGLSAVLLLDPSVHRCVGTRVRVAENGVVVYTPSPKSTVSNSFVRRLASASSTGPALFPRKACLTCTGVCVCVRACVRAYACARAKAYLDELQLAVTVLVRRLVEDLADSRSLRLEHLADAVGLCQVNLAVKLGELQERRCVLVRRDGDTPVCRGLLAYPFLVDLRQELLDGHAVGGDEGVGLRHGEDAVRRSALRVEGRERGREQRRGLEPCALTHLLLRGRKRVWRCDE